MLYYGTETREGIRKKFPVFVDKASFFSRTHKHRTWEPLAQPGCNVLLDLAPQLSPLPTTDTSSTRASVHQTVVTTYHTVNDISTLALSSLQDHAKGQHLPK